MSQSEREQLRAANRVVPVSKEDEGVSWSKISNGVYGFTYTPANSDGGLFMKDTRHGFEMHKLADGSLRIVAYTTPEYAAKIESEAAQDLEVYPIAKDEFAQVVTIPHARVISSKALDRDDFNKLKVSLRPVD